MTRHRNLWCQAVGLLWPKPCLKPTRHGAECCAEHQNIWPRFDGEGADDGE